MNELLLIMSLVISFGGTVLFFRLFGKSGLFAWIGIAAVFANIEVTVLVNAFGMDQTLGNTLFASSFLATDILSEIYGKKDADKGVLVGIFTTVLFIILSSMWVHYIPAESDWAMPSVKALFANTPRILCASLAGYAISEVLDVWLYHKWWNLTEKKTGSHTKMLWFRNNFSTLISQLVNIVLFNFIAFFGIFQLKELISITVACYIIYVITSLLDTPFVYLARKISSKTSKDNSGRQ
ncbi:MAG: queuosine precursor transporter [Treponema sp.]